MRLKALELLGFKSFNDRCVLLFPPRGLSVIVGPNGCGKSNIVDAVLWALGEMKPTILRSKQMEDVIFNGTEGVRPSGMAEVSLIFEDPRAEGEIRVTRRIYRSGESEYLINRRPCRLKDLRDLFLGTGLGTNTYAVVPQGEVEALVTASPQYLRMLIEEAAGVSKVQEKRKETVKRLETTRQNLERLEDVISEVQRQANSLRYQAAKARRYLFLRERLKMLEVKGLALKIWEARRELEKVEEEGTCLSREREGLNERRERLRDEVLQKEEALGKLKAQLEEVNKRGLSLEGERRRLEERIKALEREKASVEKAVEEVSRRLDDTEALSAQLLKRKEELLRELESLKEQLTVKASSLEDLERALKDAEPRRRALRERRNSLRRQLLEIEGQKVRAKNSIEEAVRKELSLRVRDEKLKEELEEILKEVQRLQEGLRATKERQEELLKAKESLEGELNKAVQRERALEEALTEIQGKIMALDGEMEALSLQEEMLQRMQSDLEDYPDEVKSLLRSPERYGFDDVHTVGELLEAEKGFEKAVEAALGERIKALVARDIPEALKILEATQGKALVWIPRDGEKEGDLLRVVREKAPRGLVPSLLGGIEIVEGLPEKPRPGVEYVTKGGLFLDRRGVLWSGKVSGVLERKNLLKEIAQRLQVLRTTKDTLQVQKGKLYEEKRVADALKGELEARLRKVEADLKKETQALQDLQGEIRLLERKAEAVRIEKEGNAQELAHWREQLDKGQRGLKALEDKARAIQELFFQGEKELQEIEGELKDKEAERNRLKEELARLGERLKGKKASLEDLDHQIERAQREVDRLIEERESLLGKMKQGTQEIVQSKEALKGLLGELRALGKEREELQERIKTALEDLGSLRKELEKVEARLEEVKERLSDLRTRAEGLRVELSHLENSLRVEHSLEPGEALELLKRDPLQEGHEEEKRQLRLALERLGDVYLGAIQEYDEVDKRLKFLLSQKEDLEESIRSLEESLGEMDRRSREAFLETFERVRDIFGTLVGRLFEGGRGELVLDGGPDLGVKIFLEPKGKRLKSMELLSRGEKSLASIAFILSLFFLKPAPFCIMDEVDSALDEANIERFLNLLGELKEKCQFILITHQRRTIEAAEYVYGVTMETPGVSKVLSLRIS